MKKKKFYVIGSNVSKSPSPIIFNHWFERYSINASYKKLNVKENDLKKTIQNLKNKKDVVGFNITIPHKERVINFIFKEDTSAKKIGAINCIYKKNKKLYGTNTDWIGYKNTILKITKPEERRKKVAAIIGYGGAAKAIIYALKKLEYKEIKVFNRTVEKLKFKSKKLKAHKLSELKNNLYKLDLLINTTPINVFKNKKLNNKSKKSLVVSDIVYIPHNTGFLKNFPKNKKTHGIDMLINQAIPCFKIWFGFTPKVDQELLKKCIKKTK